MRAEMTSLFIGTNDVTPPSVPSLQFEVLVTGQVILAGGEGEGELWSFCQ